MRATALLFAVTAFFACDAGPQERVKEMDAAWFRARLQCAPAAAQDRPDCAGLAEEARNIEKVRIEPTEKGSARYVITLRSMEFKTVVFAEYPGKITDELTAARIPYSVKPR